MAKERNSSIELLRIISMLMILIIHANYIALGFPTLTEVTENTPLTFLRCFREHLCIVCVNIYILISGWFGIKSKANRFCELLIQVLTYSFIFGILSYIYNKETFSENNIIDIIIIGKQYWFIVAYILLYIMSPILNAFTENATKRDFKLVLIGFFAFEFIYGWYCGIEGFLGGYSGFHFIGLYLFARYLNIYNGHIYKLSNTKLFTLYILLSALTALYVIYIYNTKGQEIGMQTALSQIYYNNPMVVLSSAAFFIPFTKIHFSSTLINRISKSTLSVYLIHTAPFIWPHYLELFQKINAYGFGWKRFSLTILIIISTFIVCIIIDKIRILLTPKVNEHILTNVITVCKRIKEKSHNIKLKKKHIIYLLTIGLITTCVIIISNRRESPSQKNYTSHDFIGSWTIYSGTDISGFKLNNDFSAESINSIYNISSWDYKENTLLLSMTNTDSLGNNSTITTPWKVIYVSQDSLAMTLDGSNIAAFKKIE